MLNAFRPPESVVARQISVIQRLARWYLYCFRQLNKARARRWKSKRTMGVCAHDVATAFPSSSIAAPVATCRNGGRWHLISTRRTGKRRSGELVSERRNGASMSPKFRRYISSYQVGAGRDRFNRQNIFLLRIS